MHEFSICEGIVKGIVDEYEKLGPTPGKLSKVHVVIGGLHQIVPDYLESAYEVLTRDTVIDGSTMVLKLEPIRAKCPECSWTGEVTPPFFKCGACESFSIEVISGRELYLDKLEIEDDDNA